MPAFAAVMTGKGTGAIASIQIYGDPAKAILNQIFVPESKKTPEFQKGKIILGKIKTPDETIDQVTIGCESPDTFAINCHGNPLIVERIMRLLKSKGAELITAEQMLSKTLAADKTNTIAVEAKLTLPKVKTIEGTKIILNQAKTGLAKTENNWLTNLKKTTLSQIKTEADAMLEAGRIAKPLIFGCKIVLAGPPNTGKSTLLNRLAGREKAIVTDIKATTRDWVSANCRIGKLSVELIDTAGLDEKLTDDINKAAQQSAIDIINQADLILLVLDNNEPNVRLSDRLIQTIAGKKTLTVINKTDLPGRLEVAELPADFASNFVKISALSGAGFELLCSQIQRLFDIEKLNVQKPACFTNRQERLLHRLAKADSKEKAMPIITELLTGPLRV